jgi:entericidin B
MAIDPLAMVRLKVAPKRGHGAASTRGVPMRKIIILAVTATALLVSACNTVAGVGRDVEAAGKAVSGTANDMKR